MKKHRIIAIGNAIMDIIIKCNDDILKTNNLTKGSMTLIDDEMANKLSKLDIIKIDCGGSAANTIYCMSQLSQIDCEFIGKVANDSFGNQFIKKIHSQNIKFYSNFDERYPTATSFIAVTNDGQRTMCTNLGCASNILQDDIIEDSFVNADLLYLEGYLWDKKDTILALRKAISFAKKHNVKIAFSASDSFCVQRHKNDFLELLKNDINILFCNENEFLSLISSKYFDKNESISFLKQFSNLITIITRAELGSVVINNDIYENCNIDKINNVIDTTGAGDIFAAGFLHHFLNNESLAKSCNFGNKLAGKIIQNYGARFNSSDISELH
tara:strand:- start:1037 stop:2017 length:981 start_codon:yes stop_codon:yes gene_type:complete